MRPNIMSIRKRDNPYNKERLPHELFYGFIIPHLFAEYLHYAIVYDKTQKWNPFVVLPLISTEFRTSCQVHVQRIFDIDPQDDDPIKTVRRLFQSTRHLWNDGRVLPLSKRPRRIAVPSTYGNLMSSLSLIQIYICAGYAKYFYTVDVLNWLCLDRLWITGSTEDIDQSQLRGDPSIGIPKNFKFRPYKMEDDRLHRVFLPFTCAMKLCDSIRDDILAGPIADYLAKKAVTYGTEPILLKHVQDLEMNMARRYGLPIELWSKWTKDTLRLIDNRHEFLCSVQESGRLVSQYRRPSEVTKHTIKNTRLLSVLKVVSSVDWGNDTEDIREYATIVLEDLIAVCHSKAGEPEEHDEYFKHDGKKILFSQIERIPVPSSWLF